MLTLSTPTLAHYHWNPVFIVIAPNPDNGCFLLSQVKVASCWLLFSFCTSHDQGPILEHGHLPRRTQGALNGLPRGRYMDLKGDDRAIKQVKRHHTIRRDVGLLRVKHWRRKMTMCC